jgi:predicted flap endonuclease-1-like 5' DNA nuclease
MGHYYIELAAYILLAYFIGCLLGAAYRKLFFRAPVDEAVSVYSTPQVTPEPFTPAEPAVRVHREPAPEPVPAAVAPISTSIRQPAPVLAPSHPAFKKSEPVDSKPTRPRGIDGPRSGQADDLQRILGVGPKYEKLLHNLGFYHFDQIAEWTPEQIAWVDDHLQFNGRIEREEWVEQARLLSDGEIEQFTKLYGDGGMKPGKPQGLDKARAGKPDDLQRLSGVGPKNERVLHELGIFHFDQIAAWTKDEIDWIDTHLKFNGRIHREEWKQQAKLLATGKEDEFAKLYGTGGLKGDDGATRSGSRTRK